MLKCLVPKSGAVRTLFALRLTVFWALQGLFPSLPGNLVPKREQWILGRWGWSVGDRAGHRKALGFISECVQPPIPTAVLAEIMAGTLRRWIAQYALFCTVVYQQFGLFKLIIILHAINLQNHDVKWRRASSRFGHFSIILVMGMVGNNSCFL